MKVIPLTLKQANDFISANHRHHKPVTGHRFSIGLVDDSGSITGVAVVGRPVARNTDQYKVAEVLRLCTDGTRNACSMLYGACARTAKEMGFDSIQTFTLPEEGGASLKASGWNMTGESGGGTWSRTSRERTDSAPLQVKWKWVRSFSNNTEE